MHTGTIIAAFDSIAKEIKDMDLHSHFVTVYGYIHTKLGPEYIDDKTDLLLLLKWLGYRGGDSNLINLAFINYIIYYLHTIKKVPKEELTTTCNLLSIDALRLIYFYNTSYKFMSEEINLILKTLIVSKINKVVKPKLQEYNIVFNDSTLTDFGDIPKFTTIVPKERINVNQFINDKPYIFLFFYNILTQYEFTLVRDKKEVLARDPKFIDTKEATYLTQINYKGEVTMVSAHYRSKKLEAKILKNINICTGHNYQELFVNLKENKFTPKTLHAYYAHEVTIIPSTLPFYEDHAIIPKLNHERK
jgi:hypothetical protein